MVVIEEIQDLIKLISRLDELRQEFTLTFEGLHKVTGIMQDFAWETTSHHPLHSSELEESNQS